jgi:acyl-CoA synthetase (AMP-forming)/AMP-acid ligase II
LPALLGRVRTASLDRNRNARWLLTYETHSFAGLQVVLSAALSGGQLVAPEVRNAAALAAAARAEDVTHISGTPTFWRALLLAVTEEGLPALRQITIGGEAVDQATLDRLSRAFPNARISHIYASTEAGSLFAVHDARVGFPQEWLDSELPGGVVLRVRDGVLEVRSPRRMVAYASGERVPVTDDGWLVTGDLVRVEADRVIFCGRLDHIVNVAGLKVSPEEVEAFLLSQPVVAEAQVYAVPSPLTGALLAARVVLRPGSDPRTALNELRAVCASDLPRHKIPRRFDLVDSIAVSTSGKKAYAL